MLEICHKLTHYIHSTSTHLYERNKWLLITCLTEFTSYHLYRLRWKKKFQKQNK